MREMQMEGYEKQNKSKIYGDERQRVKEAIRERDEKEEWKVTGIKREKAKIE